MSSTSYSGAYGGDGLIELYWKTQGEPGGSTAGSFELLIDTGIINRDFLGPYSTVIWWGSSDIDNIAAHISVYIAGNEFPFIDNTLRIDHSLGSRGQGNFRVWDQNSTWVFTKGENIQVFVEGNILWSGVVNKITRTLPSSEGMMYNIQGIDWNYGLDKRRVVMTFPNTSTATSTSYYDPMTMAQTSILNAGYIVDKMTSQYLIEEGFTIEYISTGAAINSAGFNYITPSHVLDVLAEQSGYVWQINPNKSIAFKPHNFDHFAFEMASTLMQKDSIQYIEGSPKYRNVQYVVGGMNLTSPTTETELGDSKKQAFVMQYPLMQVPAISLIKALGTTSTGTNQTVGILGIDTTKQWYWNKLSNIVTQQTTDTAATTSQALCVTYVGGFPSVARTEDSVGIANLRSYEGGSGIVEDAVYKNADSLYTDNKIVANNMIARYSTQCDTLKFKTMRPGLRPGGILRITIPEFNLDSDEFLVDSVSMQDVDGMYIWYSVDCLSGYDLGGWSGFFETFLQNTIEKDIWEGASVGDILEVVTAVSGTVKIGSSFATTSYSCLTPATSMFAATTNYPC